MASLALNLQASITQAVERIFGNFLAFFALYLLYTVFLVVYRLYFSPIAKFPGPKLAALTYWVETYYEIWKGEGGQFSNAYRKWHDKYGLKNFFLLYSCY